MRGFGNHCKAVKFIGAGSSRLLPSAVNIRTAVFTKADGDASGEEDKKLDSRIQSAYEV
jgi:hypothetical protein